MEGSTKPSRFADLCDKACNVIIQLHRLEGRKKASAAAFTRSTILLANCDTERLTQIAGMVEAHGSAVERQVNCDRYIIEFRPEQKEIS
jgi:hypothetical protein